MGKRARPSGSAGDLPVFHVSKGAPVSAARPVISGHPSIEAQRPLGLEPLVILSCAGCGETKNLLVQRDGSDRFHCLSCGGRGAATRQQISFSLPDRLPRRNR